MRTGDKPRQSREITGNHGQSREITGNHGATPAQMPDTIQRAIDEWNLVHPDDEPFIDQDEMQDPRVRMWREALRQRYNFNKSRK
jgi:hypothetical protein